MDFYSCVLSFLKSLTFANDLNNGVVTCTIFLCPSRNITSRCDCFPRLLMQGVGFEEVKVVGPNMFQGWFNNHVHLQIAKALLDQILQ